MMRALILGGALAATVLGAGVTDAATTEFGGTLDLRAGYGSNPYLTSTSNGGSVLLGGTLSAGLTSRATRSTTILRGVADVQQNLRRYGRNENYTVGLSRSQQLSERLTLNADVGYANTINPGGIYQNTLNSGAIFQNTLTPVVVVPGDAASVTATPVTTVPIGSFDPSNLDLFTLGQRSERYSAGAGLTWAPTARDQFTLGGNASRVHYKNFNGNYDQYGGSFGYLRTLTQRTRVGLNASYNDVQSDNFSSARSYNASLVLVQQLSSHWNLNASVGGILPRGRGGQANSLTLGFNLALCGNYGRSNICFTGSRQSAPTGIGGLRTDLQGGVTLSYDLTEHDHLNGGANIDHSQAGSLLPRQNFYQASAGLSHDLSSRISIGGSARYQRRESKTFFGNASGYAVTIDLITRFGRVTR